MWVPVPRHTWRARKTTQGSHFYPSILWDPELALVRRAFTGWAILLGPEVSFGDCVYIYPLLWLLDNKPSKVYLDNFLICSWLFVIVKFSRWLCFEHIKSKNCTCRFNKQYCKSHFQTDILKTKHCFHLCGAMLCLQIWIFCTMFRSG